MTNKEVDYVIRQDQPLHLRLQLVIAAERAIAVKLYARAAKISIDEAEDTVRDIRKHRYGG